MLSQLTRRESNILGYFILFISIYFHNWKLDKFNFTTFAKDWKCLQSCTRITLRYTAQCDQPPTETTDVYVCRIDAHKKIPFTCVPLGDSGVRQWAYEKIIVHRKLVVVVLRLLLMFVVIRGLAIFFQHVENEAATKSLSKLHRMLSYMVVTWSYPFVQHRRPYSLTNNLDYIRQSTSTYEW